MTEPNNETRRQRAEETLRHYVTSRDEVYEGNSSEAADLIADILHWVAKHDEGFDPVDSTIRLARMHFDAEHGNPEEEPKPS
jgi:hypothetical protein